MAEYFTKEGLENLKKELNYLKTKRRQEVAKAIAEAVEKGDLSENAEYEAAKEEQDMLENQIAKLEKTFAKARVIDESKIDDSKVFALSTVHVKNHNNGKELKYKLVSEKESNLKEGKISLQSPIGKGLLGKEEGEVVNVQVPAGTLKLEILNISREG